MRGFSPSVPSAMSTASATSPQWDCVFAPGEQHGQEAGLLAQLGTWQAMRQVSEPTCPQMYLFICAVVAPTACAPSLSVGAGLGAAGGSPWGGTREEGVYLQSGFIRNPAMLECFLPPPHFLPDWVSLGFSWGERKEADIASCSGAEPWCWHNGAALARPCAPAGNSEQFLARCWD